MLKNDIELTIISPFYNEKAIIVQSITKLRYALERLSVRWELLLINDGSTDGSGDLAAQAVEGVESVRLLGYSHNRGRGYALRHGFEHSRGRYVITTESDLTWGADIIEKLYQELIRSDADVVIASPYAQGGKLENVPFTRALLSWLGNRLLRLTVPSNITMLSGMTRGYRGDMIRALPLEENGKEIHLEIVSKACMAGYVFSEIPATLRWEKPAPGQAKRRSKFKAGRLIRSHLLFGFHEAPIMLFGAFGGTACLLGFGLGMYLCYCYFFLGEVIGDRIALILTTIFLILSGFSTFLFCFLSYQIKLLRKDIFLLRRRIE